MSPQEILRRAGDAKVLLENRLLIEALETIEKDILEQWEACPARDQEGREELWKYYKTSKKFRGILQGMIESGKVVQFHEKSLKDKVFDMVRS